MKITHEVAKKVLADLVEATAKLSLGGDLDPFLAASVRASDMISYLVNNQKEEK